MFIYLPATAAAEDSDEDAEHVTGVDRSSAEDDLGLGCVLGFDFGGEGGGLFLTFGVVDAK